MRILAEGALMTRPTLRIKSYVLEAKWLQLSLCYLKSNCPFNTYGQSQNLFDRCPSKLIMRTVAPEGKKNRKFGISCFGAPTPQSMANAQRWNIHIPGSCAAGRRFLRRNNMGKVQRRNVDVHGSCATGRRFLRRSLWRTCSAATFKL